MQALSLLVSLWIFMVLELAVWFPVSEQWASGQGLEGQLAPQSHIGTETANSSKSI